MFALSVAVSPDHELVRVAGLRLEVSNEILRPSWIFDHGWRVKKLEWVARLPRLERSCKVELCEMACDIGDDECCTRFWIVKSVVFYRWYVRINLSIPTQRMSFYGSASVFEAAHRVVLAARKNLCDRLCDRRLLCYTEHDHSNPQIAERAAKVIQSKA